MPTISFEEFKRLQRGGRSRPNKYAVAARDRRSDDGIVFHSKKEMLRYRELKRLRKHGIVRYFLRQVPFDLPGPTKWHSDFLVFWSDGTTTVEDVKGYRTATYKLKKKQVEALYPITITEI